MKIDKITKATTIEREFDMRETFSAELPPFRVSECTDYPDNVYIHGPTFGIPFPATNPIRFTGGTAYSRRRDVIHLMTQLQQAYKAGMADALAPTLDPPKSARRK